MSAPIAYVDCARVCARCSGPSNGSKIMLRAARADIAKLVPLCESCALDMLFDISPADAVIRQLVLSLG